MPAKRLSMRKLKEVLRLTYSAHLSRRQIARSLSLSKTTVNKYLELAQGAGITWPLPDGMDDTTLVKALFPSSPSSWSQQFTQPDFSTIHQELKRKGVTLQLLWEEYASLNPETAYQYSWFCELYKEWRAHLRVSMRQTHRAGEKLFIDYAGQTVAIVDPATGAAHEAQVFIAVLGASNYTFVEATWSQTLSDWISSHVRAFDFFGGVPELLIPDNLRSGVSRACRYEPDLNPTYAEMAAHYGVAVMPARPYKPRDKAKVEVGVQVVERWILAKLRHQTFFSLAELNKVIRALVGGLNYRPFKKLPGTRRSQFEALDQPALRPLPKQPFEYAEWKKARVNIDYHVEVDGHYYSVPHSLVRREVEARLTATAVEFFHRGQRVASHMRCRIRGSHTTVVEHMPKAHRAHLEWTPGRFLTWAAEIGPNTRDLVRHLLFRKPHPEQGYRSCLGLLSLSRRYGSERLERACERALLLGARTRRSVDSILKGGVDRLPVAEEEAPRELPDHENVRGPAYYTDQEVVHEEEQMLTQQTLETLHRLRLAGMAQAFEQQLAQPATHDLSFEERFGLLVDMEATYREGKRLQRLLQRARLRQPQACVEDIDYRHPRGLEKRQMAALVTGDWIRARQNICITGPTGCGQIKPSNYPSRTRR